MKQLTIIFFSFLFLFFSKNNVYSQDEKPISIKLVLDEFDSKKIVNSLLPKYPIITYMKQIIKIQVQILDCFLNQ